MARRRIPFPVQHAGRADVLTLLLAAVIAGTDHDYLEVDGDALERLYELFPRGWGIVLAGRIDGGLRATLVGEESADVVVAMMEQLDDGVLPASAIPPSFLPTDRRTVHDGED